MSNKSLSRIVFAGTPLFSAVILRQMLEASLPVVGVYTQPDKPAGRGMKLQVSPVKKLALDYHIPVYQPLSLRSQEALEHFKALAPDILIVAAYGVILPQAILDSPAFGGINVHTSLLPRWRGAAPIVRAIAAGDEKTGITLMQMDAGLDTGGIISQWPCPILATDNSQTLHDRLANLGAQTLVALLQRLQQGDQLVSTPQPETGVTYAHKISKTEARIDWNKSADELALLIRAFNPIPGAYTCLNETDHVKIWEAVSIDTTPMVAEPGTLLNADEQGLNVATGKGVLCIQRLQLPGAKPVFVTDFLNSHVLQVGSQIFK